MSINNIISKLEEISPSKDKRGLLIKALKVWNIEVNYNDGESTSNRIISIDLQHDLVITEI